MVKMVGFSASKVQNLKYLNENQPPFPEFIQNQKIFYYIQILQCFILIKRKSI